MASGSCAGSFAKFILLLINLHFILLSLTLILIASRLHLDKSGNNELALNAGETSISWTTIATGCFIAGAILGIISLFGFGAALCESTFLLNAYAYFLLVILLLASSLYIYAWIAFTDKTVLQLRKHYRNLMANFNSDKHSRMVVQNIQKALYCCGDLGPEDWHNQTLFGPLKHNGSQLVNTFMIALNKSTTNLIADGFYPTSCCNQAENGQIKICPASQLVFKSGCFSSAQLSRYQYFLLGYFIAALGAILLLLTISCCLERDHELQQAKMVNMQYAAHLETCRGGRCAPMPSFLAAGGYRIPGVGPSPDAGF